MQDSLLGFRRLLAALLLATGALCGASGAPLAAQEMPALSATPSGPTFADLVALGDASELVIHVQIRRQIALKPEQTPSLAPGFARLYIEAQTLSLLAGQSVLGERVHYLVDVRRDSRGKLPKLKKQQMLLFARSVAGKPDEIQLVGPHAQLAYSPQLEQRARTVLAALHSPDAPPIISGVRDALSVKGNLTGESETQIFLDTISGAPVSISVLRRPGRPPVWGASWGEIIDAAARPPRPMTLRWYRLACALPQSLPAAANLARDSAARVQAERDYALVIGGLGPCVRRLR